MKLLFSKYSGSGNDFILIDNRDLFFPSRNKQLIATLCQRRTGIGADGIILLENSTHADFKMRIFNADGGEAEMCGNGARCLARFIQQLGFAKNDYKIEAMKSVIHLQIENDRISVSMPQPENFKWFQRLTIGDLELTLHSLNTGVPHAVIFVDELENDQWMKMAPSIRSHSSFGSPGTNVNFASVFQEGHLNIRTYERGVEGETLACGTGAIASALTAERLFRWPSPIQVSPKSKETLNISFKFEEGIPTNVKLAGPALFIFEGRISLPNQ
jgi:diaminopimelate epimerase